MELLNHFDIQLESKDSKPVDVGWTNLNITNSSDGL